MFLQPNQSKFKKFHKKKFQKTEYKSTNLVFGDVGIKILTSSIISSRQIEAARRVISRKISRKGKVWLRVFPHYSVSKKPSESRMGKGKGPHLFWAVKAFAGTVLFEVYGIPKKDAIIALEAARKKFPVKTKVVSL